MHARYAFPAPHAHPEESIHVYENKKENGIPDALEHLKDASCIVYHYAGIDSTVLIPSGCKQFIVHATSEGEHKPIDIRGQPLEALTLQHCTIADKLPDVPKITLQSCIFTKDVQADTIELQQCTDPPLGLIQARKRLVLSQVVFTAEETTIETKANVRVLDCKGKLHLKCGPIVFLARIASVPTLSNPIQALAIVHCDEIFPSASRVLEKYIQAEAIYYAADKKQNIVCGQGGTNLKVLALQDIGQARCIMNCPSLETLILVHASVERLQVNPKHVYLYGVDARIPDGPRYAFPSADEWSPKMLELSGSAFLELQAVW